MPFELYARSWITVCRCGPIHTIFKWLHSLNKLKSLSNIKECFCLWQIQVYNDIYRVIDHDNRICSAEYADKV